MRWFLWSKMLALALPATCISLPPGYEKVDDLSKKGEFHLASDQIDELLGQPQEAEARSKLLLEKAKLLCKDQKLSEAQEAFLEAIAIYPIRDVGAVSAEERDEIRSMIPLYLAASGSEENTKKLELQTQKKLNDHPRNSSFKYFLAAVSANRNDFVSFFDQFYQAYMERPDSYLAWKMRGVLHLRLFEGSSAENLRIYHRERAVEFLQTAFSREPQDGSLIAKLVFLLPQQQRKNLLEKVFQDVSQMDVPLQRSECIYLVKEAISVRSIDVAKKLIGKANIWYEYSRAIQELSVQVDLIEKQQAIQ